MARLNPKEQEDDDFVCEEELLDLMTLAKWLAIARVHTPKIFNPSALYDNLFTAQFGCLADWNKAMFEGPWLFRGHGVTMKEYDDFKKPDSILLDRLIV